MVAQKVRYQICLGVAWDAAALNLVLSESRRAGVKSQSLQGRVDQWPLGQRWTFTTSHLAGSILHGSWLHASKEYGAQRSTFTNVAVFMQQVTVSSQLHRNLCLACLFLRLHVSALVDKRMKQYIEPQ